MTEEILFSPIKKPYGITSPSHVSIISKTDKIQFEYQPALSTLTRHNYEIQSYLNRWDQLVSARFMENRPVKFNLQAEGVSGFGKKEQQIVQEIILGGRYVDAIIVYIINERNVSLRLEKVRLSQDFDPKIYSYQSVDIDFLWVSKSKGEYRWEDAPNR